MKSLLRSYLSSSLENRRKIMHYHQRAGGVACTAARKQSGDSQ